MKRFRRAKTIAILLGLALLAVMLVLGFPFLKSIPFFVYLLRQEPPALLPLPVEGVRPSQLEDTWGALRSEGRSHEGIDIFAPRGTPVRSTTRGVVVKRGWNRLGGKRMLVFGTGGWFHYYAHLEAWASWQIGDRVEVGTILGTVGDSGNARGTPPHLHYGIYGLGGKARNPYPLLAVTP
jgi:murein DD-endopeptidase MepM/ murein hydrolase activator NlpD